MFDCRYLASGQWAYKGLDMVLRFGDSPVWGCGTKSYITLEGYRP